MVGVWLGLSLALGQAPAGVYVDTDGVLRARQVARGKASERLRQAKDAARQRGFVSLPRLFAAAKAELASGGRLPDELRCPAGLVRIDHLFVFPAEKDIVLAGKCEPIDFSDPARPVGKLTGRPAIRLEDLVVAIRALGPNGKATAFGCSIDLPPDADANLRAAAGRIGGTDGTQNGRIAKTLAAAAGVQAVRLFDLPEDSGFAFRCLEADYLMKRYALGLDKSPVPAVKSYLAMMRQGDMTTARWWFAASGEPLVTDGEGTAYRFPANPLRVRASQSLNDNDAAASPAARKFAELFTANYPALAAKVPAFADLWNLHDLGLVAALLREDKLAAKAGWDLGWLAEGTAFPIPSVPTPKQVETLAGSRVAGQTLVICVGGVSVEGKRGRSTDESASEGRQRPAEGWSVTVAEKE